MKRSRKELTLMRNRDLLAAVEKEIHLGRIGRSRSSVRAALRRALGGGAPRFYIDSEYVLKRLQAERREKANPPSAPSPQSPESLKVLNDPNDPNDLKDLQEPGAVPPPALGTKGWAELRRAIERRRIIHPGETEQERVEHVLETQRASGFFLSEDYAYRMYCEALRASADSRKKELIEKFFAKNRKP